MKTLWEELLPLTRNLVGHVLDVGCGNGDDSARLARLDGVRDVISVDVVQFPEMHDQRFIDNRPQEKFVLASVENLPFANDEFDCTMAWHVVEHVDNPLLALSEIRRVTKSITSIALPIRGTYSPLESPDHWHAFTADEFKHLLEQMGFMILRYHEDQCGCQNWILM